MRRWIVRLGVAGCFMAALAAGPEMQAREAAAQSDVTQPRLPIAELVGTWVFEYDLEGGGGGGVGTGVFVVLPALDAEATSRVCTFLDSYDDETGGELTVYDGACQLSDNKLDMTFEDVTDEGMALKVQCDVLQDGDDMTLANCLSDGEPEDLLEGEWTRHTE